ncbi:MAG: diaminopropionate ammonia-lyase [Acidimicrobiales bacterium]
MTAAPARLVRNPHIGTTQSPTRPGRAPLAFHRRLPGYAATPLVDAPGLARELGLGRVLAKSETDRWGLPSFKMLGASWACYRALVGRMGQEPAWSDVGELARAVAGLGPMTLAAATDGNHGRAVAHMANLLGLGAEILVPGGTAPARIAAIEGEGAKVTVVDGDYDEAVARSAGLAGDRCLVVSDTSWPGYTEVPGWVVEGYSTLWWEVDEALDRAGLGRPDVVVVPVGVGALAAAAVAHYASTGDPDRPMVVGVEPSGADCVLRSIEAGEMIHVPGPHRSIMAGLNCGTPSLVAWPALVAGLDWCVAIDDDRARSAMVALAGEGIVAGETGAAALGGLAALVERTGAGGDLGLGPATTALVLCTEGATEPEAYTAIVGRRPEDVGPAPPPGAREPPAR